MNLWESVKELICFCERVDFVQLYAERKIIFVQKLFQSTSDVLRICDYMYTMLRESALCVKNLTCILVVLLVIMLNVK